MQLTTYAHVWVACELEGVVAQYTLYTTASSNWAVDNDPVSYEPVV